MKKFYLCKFIFYFIIIFFKSALFAITSNLSFFRFLGAVSDGEHDFIALEDVSFSGYNGIDRSQGLDLAHTRLIIKCFAIFHGISLAYKTQNPEDFKIIVSSLKVSTAI